MGAARRWVSKLGVVRPGDNGHAPVSSPSRTLGKINPGPSASGHCIDYASGRYVDSGCDRANIAADYVLPYPKRLGRTSLRFSKQETGI